MSERSATAMREACRGEAEALWQALGSGSDEARTPIEEGGWKPRIPTKRGWPAAWRI